MEVWLTICSKFQGSEPHRIIATKLCHCPESKIPLFCMRKIRDWVKPLDKTHKDFDIFLNNLNTFLFIPVLGLPMKLSATDSQSTKSQDEEFWWSLRSSSVLHLRIHFTVLITDLPNSNNPSDCKYHIYTFAGMTHYPPCK